VASRPDLGAGDTFLHEIAHLLRVSAEGGEVGPDGASFEDDYCGAEVSDAITRSSGSAKGDDVP
jgi:hypothetical protein